MPNGTTAFRCSNKYYHSSKHLLNVLQAESSSAYEVQVLRTCSVFDKVRKEPVLSTMLDSFETTRASDAHNSAYGMIVCRHEMYQNRIVAIGGFAEESANL